MKKELAYRRAGIYAVISGIIGVFAFGFLITYLIMREKNFGESIYFLRFHDFGAVLQFLFLIPVVKGLYRLLKLHFFGVTQATLIIGVGSLLFTALFLLLTTPKIMADVLYLFRKAYLVHGLFFLIGISREFYQRDYDGLE